MRVCIIGPAPPLRGGIAQHTAGLAAAIAARGHCVRVISYTRLYPRGLIPGHGDRDDGSPPLGEALLDTLDPTTWISTRKLLGRWRPDLVIAQWWHPCTAAALASVLRGLPTATAVVCHNAQPHERFPFWPALTRFALRGVDLTVCHSRAVAGDVLRIVPWASCKIVEMPLLFSPGNDSELVRDETVPLALFAGLIRGYKGVATMLEAWDRARLPPRARLVIAGQSYLGSGRLQALVRKMRREHSVVVLDRWLSDDELWGWMRRAHVLVMPYLRASQSGLVPLARAAGLRIIASDAGGLAEGLNDNPHIVFRAGDAHALTAALELAIGSASADAPRQWPLDLAAAAAAGWAAVARVCESAAKGRVV